MNLFDAIKKTHTYEMMVQLWEVMDIFNSKLTYILRNHVAMLSWFEEARNRLDLDVNSLARMDDLEAYIQILTDLKRDLVDHVNKHRLNMAERLEEAAAGRSDKTAKVMRREASEIREIEPL